MEVQSPLITLRLVLIVIFSSMVLENNTIRCALNSTSLVESLEVFQVLIKTSKYILYH